MTKVSASTLARQAAKTPYKAHAKRLRAQAAKLRREARSARVAKMHHSSVLEAKRSAEREKNQMSRALLDTFVNGGNNAAQATSVDHAPFANAPGHGEIVGGYLAHMAEGIAELARKKGGVDAIQGRLMTLEHQTRHDEKVYARERERKAVQAAREEMRDNSICGFIALVDAANNTKSMTPVSFISSDLVGHIVDALKANGYRADGKR